MVNLLHFHFVFISCEREGRQSDSLGAKTGLTNCFFQFSINKMMTMIMPISKTKIANNNHNLTHAHNRRAFLYFRCGIVAIFVVSFRRRKVVLICENITIYLRQREIVCKSDIGGYFFTCIYEVECIVLTGSVGRQKAGNFHEDTRSSSIVLFTVRHVWIQLQSR